VATFNINDKVEIIYHLTKNNIGAKGTVIYVGSSMLSNPMPVNEDYNPEQKLRYSVKLDAGTMVHDLKDIQLRKLS
jgi:hypothetical protein